MVWNFPVVDGSLYGLDAVYPKTAPLQQLKTNIKLAKGNKLVGLSHADHILSPICYQSYKMESLYTMRLHVWVQPLVDPH